MSQLNDTVSTSLALYSAFIHDMLESYVDSTYVLSNDDEQDMHLVYDCALDWKIIAARPHMLCTVLHRYALYQTGVGRKALRAKTVMDLAPQLTSLAFNEPERYAQYADELSRLSREWSDHLDKTLQVFYTDLNKKSRNVFVLCLLSMTFAFAVIVLGGTTADYVGCTLLSIVFCFSQWYFLYRKVPRFKCQNIFKRNQRR